MEIRMPATNIGLPQWGLTCFYETFVLKQTAVLRLNITANNPSLRQAEARYHQCYTTDSDHLDFVVGIDDKCQWNAIPFLNQYQGMFHKVILSDEFNATLLKNEVSGRYSTTLNEMHAKQLIIDKANTLLAEINTY
ncbi:MAG: hypothetical protein QY309_08290 [Cyclobacteriaceae bacterium]|nr:MAG: hypothetical protein QY309_08290 [Cyclobacteriaceae bacterium]